MCIRDRLELVYDGDGGGEVEKANSVMQDQFQANTDISAVICSNDEQAVSYTHLDVSKRQLLHR